jgi:hypothetical protein
LRAYGFDLVMFGRWLLGEAIGIDGVITRVLLRYLAACREARLPGTAGPKRGRHVRSPPGRVCDGDGEPASGGGVGAVRVPGDARPVIAEPGAERP